MLYPVLHWLEDHGQIRGRWVKVEGENRRRRYYTLQTKGRDALQNHRAQWNLITNTFEKLWRPRHA